MNTAKRICKVLSAVILMILIISSTPLTQIASAEKNEKIVRVGWYESTFNSKDEQGRRTGYAYEYQQKIASYTGWKYEYVEASWPELMQMLIDGKIDLMSDVSYTTERAEKMLFSTIPMGEEEYYLFTTPNNADVNTDDYSTFNGKTVGINKGSVQIDLFKEWAKNNDLEMTIVELTGSVNDSIAMLASGKIEFYVSPETMRETAYVPPVAKIGSSSFYFSVNKSRPDLLSELNIAMNKITEKTRITVCSFIQNICTIQKCTVIFLLRN